MHAMYLSVPQKGWSQDPRPHLRVGSGSKSILQEIPVYLVLFQGKIFFFPLFLYLHLLHLSSSLLAAA